MEHVLLTAVIHLRRGKEKKCRNAQECRGMKQNYQAHLDSVVWIQTGTSFLDSGYPSTFFFSFWLSRESLSFLKAVIQGGDLMSGVDCCLYSV